jgi:hypothetical protein
MMFCTKQQYTIECERFLLLHETHVLKGRDAFVTGFTGDDMEEKHESITDQ